ncbi:hypothetical protein AB6A40_008981 [Gnathostoma spinigerum]|uniref:Large subunit GTPase 1 homolog n=1 Tax=Gnathostoma spinigerum TaxID=75299 RepID=A0ABD6ET15_9BILA
MTKRRPSNRRPKGDNKDLGSALVAENGRNRRAYRSAIKEDYPSLQHSFNFREATARNVDSIVAESSLDEFMHKAELAGTKFTADRDEVKVLEKEIVHSYNIPTGSSIRDYTHLKAKYSERLKIPRMPPRMMWRDAAELNKAEQEMFLKWRTSLADLQQVEGLTLTPFERNLELWRQLWRVVEKSDIIVQVVDARNPLLFRSIDLECYVKECDIGKQCILLINKADLLTSEQISLWRKWFAENDIEAIFWSATDVEKDESSKSVNYNDSSNPDCPAVETKDLPVVDNQSTSETEQLTRRPYMRTSKELLSYLKMKSYISSKGDLRRPLVVGMVGYPNVGKSSTINRIIGEKKVPVSATPGKTKHLQTLVVDSEITLCDCPGLVMPSFAFSRSEMLLSGILPIDQMRDHLEPVTLLISRIPRQHFESKYSIMLRKPADNDDHNELPTANELLTTVAFMKGYMSHSGVPDCSRAARLILKEVVSGVLKWVASPPNIDQELFDALTYQSLHESAKFRTKGAVVLHQLENRHLLEDVRSSDVDGQFFDGDQSSAHICHLRGACSSVNNAVAPNRKKHHNKNKREKLRRIFAHLDA